VRQAKRERAAVRIQRWSKGSKTHRKFLRWLRRRRNYRGLFFRALRSLVVADRYRRTYVKRSHFLALKEEVQETLHVRGTCVRPCAVAAVVTVVLLLCFTWLWYCVSVSVCVSPLCARCMYCWWLWLWWCGGDDDKNVDDAAHVQTRLAFIELFRKSMASGRTSGSIIHMFFSERAGVMSASSYTTRQNKMKLILGYDPDAVRKKAAEDALGSTLSVTAVRRAPAVVNPAELLEGMREMMETRVKRMCIAEWKRVRAGRSVHVCACLCVLVRACACVFAV
jgi:hypothetical protein